MNQTVGKAKGFMAGFTPGQRSIVIVAILGLLMGAFALSRWAAQPTWAPLYGNLSGTDANAIVDQLNTDGVTYKLADGGTTILVPQSKVAAERISLAGKGLTGGNGSSTDGWSILDKQGITATDFQQNIAYQRAIEGELSKTLEAMNGVNTAIVHLAVPKKDVFTSETDKTTASVLLNVQPGTTLTTEQVNSITHLVAGSVAGLDPGNVTVTDQTGKMLSNTTSGAGNAGQTDEQTASFEERMSAKVQAVLDSVVGTGHSAVQVSAQLDFNNTDTTSETFATATPTPPPLSQATVQEQYSGNGANTGGTLGQILPTPIVTASGSGSYVRNQSTVNNAVGKTVQKVITAPGQVQRMTVAVVLDSKTAGALNPAQVQQIVANSVGLNTARGDTVQVSTLPFDTTASAAATKELAAAAKAQKTGQYLQLAKKVAIALLILIIFIVLMRRRKKDEPVVDASASDLPQPAMILNPAPPPALSAGAQLAITQQADISRDRMRDEVAALVDSQPDDVAQMLQGWLAERKV
jgi:flagellar M-ring protein FliF